MHDVFTYEVKVGLGLSASTRLAPVGLTLGTSAGLLSFGKPLAWSAPSAYESVESGPPANWIWALLGVGDNRGDDEYSTRWIALTTYGYHAERSEIPILTRRKALFVDTPDSRDYLDARARLVDDMGVEASAFLGVVGLRVGINFAELADFAVGWFGIELTHLDESDGVIVPPWEKPPADDRDGANGAAPRK